MSDKDNEEDLSKFIQNDEDDIKPIDIGGGQDKSAPNPVPEPNHAPEPNPAPPIPDANLPGDAETNPAPENTPKEQKPFLMDDDWSEESKETEPASPETKITAYDNEGVNFINKGEYADLLEKTPTLKSITIGAGWAQKSFEEAPIDVDLSMFLLDKTDMTRIDEDFIFYNNESACDGAVCFQGDSRTGAGDGDDENIFIDLNGISFDIIKIIFVFSIYDPEIKGHHFGMVKNMFFNIVNKDDGHEIVRYRLNPSDHKGGNAMIVATLLREGPKWIMEASADITNAGLAKFATDYGIIVKELQTTGDDAVGEEVESPPQKNTEDSNET